MTNSVLVRRSESGLARKNSINLRDCRPENVKLDKTLSFKQWHLQDPVSLEQSVANNGYKHPISPISLPEPASEITFFSPKPVNELDDAAVKLQKVYKSYRTRRNLADCAVVVEELWWKELDIASLKKDSVYFFDDEKPETALSKWARAGSRAAKVGKGLLKHEKAQKLALQHWLEAIDPRHRYGHNLHLFYDVWFRSESHEPFFYWLDVGGGKDVILEKCPRSVLHRQCIEYLGPKERKVYEVVVKSGKLVYRQSREPVNTIEGSKWIFVLSTTRALYVGQKKKGKFQHSSFLAGSATTAAGRLVVHDGVLEAVWPYSGHYHPTEEHFKEFIAFLEENQVDLTNVKMCAMDDDRYPVGEEGRMVNSHSRSTISPDASPPTELNTETSATLNEESKITDVDLEEKVKPIGHVDGPRGFSLADRLSRTWTTGAGPRIGCVRDYPTELQSRALEQVNLSPRMACGPFPGYGPIPSPRPSPKHRLSPRIMGLPSPRSPISV